MTSVNTTSDTVIDHIDDLFSSYLTDTSEDSFSPKGNTGVPSPRSLARVEIGFLLCKQECAQTILNHPRFGEVLGYAVRLYTAGEFSPNGNKYPYTTYENRKAEGHAMLMLALAAGHEQKERIRALPKVIEEAERDVRRPALESISFEGGWRASLGRSLLKALNR